MFAVKYLYVCCFTVWDCPLVLRGQTKQVVETNFAEKQNHDLRHPAHGAVLIYCKGESSLFWQTYQTEQFA